MNVVTEQFAAGAIGLAETGRLPDAAIRFGARRAAASRRAELAAEGGAEQPVGARPGPTGGSRAQLGELPPRFYDLVLGPWRLATAGYWPGGVSALGEAEESMLALVVERAGIEEGMDVMELGGGWGGLSVWLARTLPGSRITFAPASPAHHRVASGWAAAAGVANLEVAPPPGGEPPPGPCDRVVAMEGTERLADIAGFLRVAAERLSPDGRLFVSMAAHRRRAYRLVERTAGDWAARYFFDGAVVASPALFDPFTGWLEVREHWRLGGEHVALSFDAWLANFEAERAQIAPIFEEVYGRSWAGRWQQRWRMMLMGVAELFRFRHGEEWGLSQFLLDRPSS